MREISEEYIQQLKSGYLTYFILFEFTDGSNWFRFTSSDVPIYWSDDSTSANKYTPYPYELESISYSYNNVVDSAKSKISNLNSAMTATFANVDMQGNESNIYIGITDSNKNIIDVLKIFEGEIDEFDLNEQELNVTISSYFAKWSHKSENKHGGLCRWKRFKGNECGYSGAETECNRTYKRCNQLGNIDNYGGFLTAAVAADKIIWWGPNPSERRDEG